MTPRIAPSDSRFGVVPPTFRWPEQALEIACNVPLKSNDAAGMSELT